jgi:hypothetical protein
LSFNNAEEIVAFCFGLSCHHRLTFLELSLSCNFKFLSLTHVFFFFSDFFLSCLSLALFKGTFCPQSIDLSLTVSSFLLHGSQTGNLHLFFFLDTLFLCGFSCFSRGLVCVVLNDLLFLIDFFLAGLLLLLKSNLVCSLYFSNHFQIANALLFCCFDLCKSQGLDLASHLFLFLGKKFTLTDALFLTLLNLVNYDKSAFSLLLLADDLTLFSNLETFQTFNLHEQVELFLLFNPLTLELLVFL